MGWQKCSGIKRSYLVLMRKKLLPLWLDSIWKCWMRQFLVVQ